MQAFGSKNWWFATVLACICMPMGAHGQIYRCGSAYSDAPCEGARAIDLQLPAKSPNSDGALDTVFLCRLGAQQFWASNSCQSHNASMLYRHSVPMQWTWEQKQQDAQRQWQQSQSARKERATRAPAAATAVQPKSRNTDSWCEQAEQRIRKVDAMARQGGKAKYMERLRAERQALRDRQFREGC